MIRVSTTADRAKYHNLRREPWAALKVDGESFWSYAVLEGDVSFSDVAAEPGDAAVEELVELFRSISGEHSDWDDYRSAMVAEQRVVVRLHAHPCIRRPALKDAPLPALTRRVVIGRLGVLWRALLTPSRRLSGASLRRVSAGGGGG